MTDPQQYASMDPYSGGMAPDGGMGMGMAPVEDPHTWRTKGAWRHWRSFPRVLPYLRPYRRLYVVVIIFTLLGSVIALAQPWPLAIMVDSVLGNEKPTSFLSGIFGSDPDPYALLVFIVIAGFVITILGHGMTVLNNYVSAKLEQNMILDLRSDMFEHCERLSLTFHDTRYTGMLMMQINMMASAVGDVVMAFPPMFQSGLTLIGMLVIALLIDWQVTLVSLVALPFLYYAIGLYGTRIVPRVQRTMSLEMGSLSIVFEAMSMLRVIVSFGREKYEHRRFRAQGQTAVDARVGLTVRQTMFGLAIAAATALGTALVLGFGAWHVLRGDITVGELLVLISYIAAVYQPLEEISNTIGSLHQQFVFLNAALNVLEEEPEVVEKPGAVHIGRSTGGLEVEDLCFAYKDREDTIKNVSFSVKPGQHVAIVGPTGAGKTTLVNLILRFYEPESGRVLIDGADITDITLASLREQLTVVLQEPLLFSGTIAENIRYGRLDAAADDITEAAKNANAHDFIMGLPMGYETELGEGGHQLSGGERQRICVARAFIKNAPILILDEPTSSIDSKTESVILDALDDLMVGRTSIMIAHRLSTIHHADLILVLNHGELVEQGTHDELLAIGGLYSQLYEAQTRIRSRTLTEGAAGYEGQLIDTISQEVAERAYVSHGNGEPTPDGDERPVEPPAVERPVEPQPVEPVSFEAESAPPPGERELLAPASAGPAPTPNGAKPPVVPPKRSWANGRKRAVVKIVGEREDTRCDFCMRTLLRGEEVEPYVAPARSARKPPDGQIRDRLTSLRRMQGADLQHMLVCELCWDMAEEAGWAPLPVVGGRR